MESPTWSIRTGSFGHQTLDEDDENRTFQWNGGRGLLCKFHAKRTLNADWLSYYSPPAKTYDQQFNAGLTYRFGRGEHNDWY